MRKITPSSNSLKYRYLKRKLYFQRILNCFLFVTYWFSCNIHLHWRQHRNVTGSERVHFCYHCFSALKSFDFDTKTLFYLLLLCFIGSYLRTYLIIALLLLQFYMNICTGMSLFARFSFNAIWHRRYAIIFGLTRFCMHDPWSRLSCVGRWQRVTSLSRHQWRLWIDYVSTIITRLI